MQVPKANIEELDSRLPSAPSSRAGKKIRALAGPDEEILRQCPEERTVYTGLGGVILATGVMAAVSMTVAIQQALNGNTFESVLIGLIWGIAIINVDRWLITSASAAGLRVRSLLPRVLLAVVLGIVIAQPLVLLTFRTEVAARISEDNQDEVSAYTGNLARCNPPETVSGPASTPAGCNRYTINAPSGGVTAIKSKITNLQSQLKLTESAMAADDAQIANLQQQKEDEAAGVTGGDHSGVYGIGPVWQALNADQQKVIADRNGLQAQDDSLNSQIGQLQSSDIDAVKKYDSAVADQIARLTKARAAALAKSHGLLKRMEALGELSDAHPTLLVSRWFVTLFLILFDSLPVLGKMMMGATTYDKILRARLVGRLQVSEDEISLGVHASRTRLAIEREEIELQSDIRRARVDLEARLAAAELNAQREAAKKRLYNTYRAEANVTDIHESEEGANGSGAARSTGLSEPA